MKSKLIWAVCVLLVASAMPAVTGYWVFQRLEHSLNVPVGGRFEPRLLQASFVVRDAVLMWDNKISLQSGDITVDYNLWSLFSEKGIRIKLSGQKLPVTLLGELAPLAPQAQVTVDDFFADLLFDGEGLKEISALRVKSPELQFQIGRSSV